MVWIFTYGLSNHPETIKKDIGHFNSFEKTVLADHVYTFTGYHETFKGGTSTIIPMEGGQVLGVAYEIDDEKLKNLVSNGHGYELRTHTALINNKSQEVYILQPKEVKEVNLPALDYIETVREGLYYHYPKEMVDLYLKRALNRAKKEELPIQRETNNSYKKEYGAFLRRLYPWKRANKSPFGSGLLVVNPNESTSPHSHDEEETFVILEGEGVVSIDNHSENVSKGDAIYFEPYSVHSIKNIGAEPLKFIAIWWGAVGVEQYVLENY
ncbi:cupin domain-containing protein [Halobacillus sp. B23F22_1]|uniref:cupin domain-containing protein n=1 Tax=Halobacillus sp. B23F22_1 TaxID=3459514 RepID=UPI00373FAF88